MKKFLFVHDIEKGWLENHLSAQHATQNVAVCWLKCFDQGEADCQSWQAVTAEECNEFEYVMFWLLTEPGNPEKYEKILRMVREMKTASIAYCDGPVGGGYQMNSLPLNMKKTWLAISREADHMFCYSLPESIPYWRAIRGGQHFHAIECPYPIEVVGRHFHAIDRPHPVEAAKTVQNIPKGPYVALPKGIQNINEERNIFSSLAVARFIHDRYGLSVFLHTATPIEDKSLMNDCYALAGLTGVEEIELRPWGRYLKDLARARIAVHLDILETRGQFALDCATVGVPLVCSGSVAGQRLYPYTYLEYPRDIDRACHLADRLLSDPGFCNQVVDHAREALTSYSYAAVRRQFDRAVAS